MTQSPHRPRFRVRSGRLARALVVASCLLAGPAAAVAAVHVERPAAGTAANTDPASPGLSPYERGRTFGKGAVLLAFTGFLLWRFLRANRD